MTTELRTDPTRSRLDQTGFPAGGNGSWFAHSSLWQLTLVRFREFWREPEAVFWTFVFPILLAAGLGIAFRNRPTEIVRIGATRPELAATLRSGKSLSAELMDRAAGEQALRAGRIALLALPGETGGVVYRYDDTNPDGRLARLLAHQAVLKAAGVQSPVQESDDIAREPGARYIDFLLPGLLGMNLMGSGVWSIGFAIVDARRKKLLKRLVASPMSRVHYLLSFLISRIVLLSVEVAVLAGFGALVFGVPYRGPLWQLALSCLVAGLSFTALGLLLASRVRTIEAISGMANFVMLPMWIFSGVFFSSSRFPAVFQPLIHALPLTAAVDALRANMLEGAGFASYSGELAIMGAWLAVCFGTALALFRWR